MAVNRKRRTVLAGAAAAASMASWPLILSSARAQKAEHTMMLGYSFTAASEKYGATAIEHFKALAEKYGGGRLAIDVYGGGILGDQAVMVQKVQQGVIQATQISMQNFTQFSPAYNVIDFPYLFNGSRDVFEKFLDHPFLLESAFGKEAESKGLMILPGMWANFGMRSIGVSKKKGAEIRRPGDLRGVKVRVTTSKVEQQAFALTPGSPVSINWGETYQAMQQGTCDALNVAMGPLAAARINETMASCTFINATPNAHVTVMNVKWFNGLPSGVKDAILRAASEAWVWQKSEQKKLDERTLAEWKAGGMKVIFSEPDERKEWIAAIGHQRPEWDQWKDRFGRELYRKTLEVIGKLA
jgi:TRAP-type C4-dicarboxylate transport system substrate-binding protein